jgi:hypothetical protein
VQHAKLPSIINTIRYDPIQPGGTPYMCCQAAYLCAQVQVVSNNAPGGRQCCGDSAASRHHCIARSRNQAAGFTKHPGTVSPGCANRDPIVGQVWVWGWKRANDLSAIASVGHDCAESPNTQVAPAGQPGNQSDSVGSPTWPLQLVPLSLRCPCEDCNLAHCDAAALHCGVRILCLAGSCLHRTVFHVTCKGILHGMNHPPAPAGTKAP